MLVTCGQRGCTFEVEARKETREKEPAVTNPETGEVLIAAVTETVELPVELPEVCPVCRNPLVIP